MRVLTASFPPTLKTLMEEANNGLDTSPDMMTYNNVTVVISPEEEVNWSATK